MKRWWKYLLLLLWLSYLYVCGVLLFARGFLLTRQALPNNATCNQHDCKPYQLLSESEPTLLHRRLYLDCLEIDQLRMLPASDFKHFCKANNRKIILLVIDALKYDFALYNASLSDQHRLPYQNRLPIFDELLRTLPNNSRLFKFIANPPTTTLQRLKGMTTGSLPTFIDAGLNFGTSEINEDNLLNQMLSQGKNIVTMGDDVWPSLYPNRSLREYPYPSFNMFDLDTVDNGVVKHLKRELYEKDWHLLIAHFLGVDHCGHAFGPNHPEMARKLSQMNNIIRDVVDSMDDDTMLFVVGDHGMTVTGDHGGDSDDEVSAALFAYSPIPMMPQDVAPIQTEIYQVDLVPTVAFLTGTAIPFSNLGKVVLDLLPQPTQDDSTTDTYVPYATEALVANIEQIMLYINTYSRHTHLFSKDKISNIASKLHDLRDNLEHVRDAASFNIFRTKSLRFLNYVRELFEEIWVQFDSFLMSRGLVLSFLLLTFTFILVEGLPVDKMESVLDGKLLHAGYGVIMVGAISGFIAEQLKIVEDGVLLMWVTTLTLSIFVMAVVVVQNWKAVSSLVLLLNQKSWLDLVPRCLFVCSLLLFFSNSYVVEEGQVMLFLTISLVLHMAWIVRPTQEPAIGSKARRDDRSWFAKYWAQPRVRVFVFALILATLLRLSVFSWRCREEQSWCIDNLRKGSRGSLSLLATLSLLGLLTTAVRMWLRACGNLVGFSPAVTLARYAPSVIVVCIGGYWVLQGRGKPLMSWQQQLLPWVVYGFVALGLLIAILQPLCVYVIDKRNGTLSVYGRDNIIPQLFHQVKEVMSEKSRKWESPIVYGLGTAYSSVLVALSQYLCLLFAMLLGEHLASSAVAMFFSALVVLLIHAYTRLETSLVTAQLLHVPWSSVIMWGFLSSYYFYGTGHQSTFPTIQWQAAFVGTGGQFSNNFVPAFLIGANTFSSQALMGLLLPLLLISPLTLHVMLPKWLPLAADREGRALKDEMLSQLKQGEILLYEKESYVQYSAFRLASKYLLFHAARVIACMLATSFHCRHLMVWKIFAPRFIFEGLSFFVTLATLSVSYLVLARVSIKIDQTLVHLTKNS